MVDPSIVKLIASASFPVILAAGGIYLIAQSSITPLYGLIAIGLGFFAFIIEIIVNASVKEMEYETDKPRR